MTFFSLIVRLAYKTLAQAPPKASTEIRNPGANERHDSLSLPQAGEATPSILHEESPAVIREDYPGVQYWHKSHWEVTQRNFRDVTRVGDADELGTLNELGFLEDAHGNAPGKDKLSEMRKHARRIFQSLLERGQAPDRWAGSDNLPKSEYFRKEMAVKFPDIRLCDNDWMANKMATLVYPAWIRNRREAVPIGGVKRRRLDSDGRVHAKKAKAQDTERPSTSVSESLSDGVGVVRTGNSPFLTPMPGVVSTLQSHFQVYR